MDTNKDKKISEDEMTEWLKRESEKEASSVDPDTTDFPDIDRNSDQKIDIVEIMNHQFRRLP